MRAGKRVRLLEVTECLGGGVLAYLTQLCNLLCDEFDVYLAYATRAQTPDDYRERFDPCVQLIELPRVGDISPAGMRRTVADLRLIERELEPDVIHLHSSIAGAIGRVAFDRRRRPLVYTPHGYAHVLLGGGPKSIAFHAVEKMLGDRALTLNCCEGEDEVAATLGRDHTWIETGLDVAALDRALAGVKPRSFDRFTVFSIGKAYVQKQPWLFNRVAELVPEADFVWIGGGELEHQLSAPNVTCTGWLPREEALATASGADAFVLCSKGEAIAMSLVEAMYLRKLCLVSDVMGNSSVIRDGRNGWLCREPEDYALRIREAMEHYPQALADQARADIDEVYNTKTMRARFVEFYRGLVQ